jgi:hypothetical protein
MGEAIVQRLNITADGDQSSNQYKFMKGDTTGVALQDSAGANCVGVLQNAPTDGLMADVAVGGKAFVMYGDTVSLFEDLASSAAGLAVPATDDDYPQAIALEAGVSGDIRPVLLVSKARDHAELLPVTYVQAYLALASIADGDVMLIKPGIVGTIIGVQYSAIVGATTADKATTLNLEIGTTDLTGGVLALTTANCAAGGRVDATAITDNNTLAADSVITVEASSTTAFVEGTGMLTIAIQQSESV